MIQKSFSNLTFNWIPQEESSATFTVLNDSMKKSKLEMINFAPGLFKFNLTVTGKFSFCFQFYILKNLDGQRQSSSELVQLLVSEAESLRYTIETRSILCQDLKFKDRTNIAEEILLYLKALGATTITIVDIYTDHASGVSFR